MGNLKFKPKKTADVARVAAMIKGINDLIAMGLISFTPNAEAYIFPEILVGKSDEYYRNFCKNLLTYWRIHSGKKPEATRNTILGVYDKTTNRMMFNYSDFQGPVFVDHRRQSKQDGENGMKFTEVYVDEAKEMKF